MDPPVQGCGYPVLRRTFKARGRPTQVAARLLDAGLCLLRGAHNHADLEFGFEFESAATGELLLQARRPFASVRAAAAADRSAGDEGVAYGGVSRQMNKEPCRPAARPAYPSTRLGPCGAHS